MRSPAEETRNGWNRQFLATVGMAGLALSMVVGALKAPLLRAQAPVAQSPATPAPGKMAFDVASVKPSKSSDRPYSNVPLSPGDVYPPNGGLFAATNFPLIAYIEWAYDITGAEALHLDPQLPRWVIMDRFDIQARTEGNPTIGQMRLMMQSLSADRFKLAVHTDTKQGPVFDLVLSKPGKAGPQLQQDAEPCSVDP